MQTINVKKGSKLENHLQKWLADKREIESELMKGNRDIYKQKGLRLADPLSNSAK